MNPSPHDDSQLESLLRHATPEVPDAGFATRVLAALPRVPQPAPAARRSARWLICLIGGAVGFVFAISRGLSVEAISAAEIPVRQALASASATLTEPYVVLASVVAIVSVIYAVRGRLLPRFG